MSDQADITLAKQIARRGVARHERKHAAKLNAAALRIAALESSLNTAQATVSEQSSELRDAGEAVELLQARVAELEVACGVARSDADHHQRNFDRLLNAVHSMQTGEFAHIAAALRRREALT